MIRLIALFFSAFTALQGQQAASLLKNIQEKFNSAPALSGSFAETVKGKELKASSRLEGKFFYKRKDRYRLEMKNRILVSDGKSVWNYDPLNKKVVISSASESSGGISLDKFVNQYPEECSAVMIKKTGPGESGAAGIKLVPKSKNAEFKEIIIWPDGNFGISGIDITDSSGTQYILQLTGLSYDKNTADAKFTFLPSPGTKVIDLR